MGHFGTHGTCVIGQLTNSSAFASVEHNGHVWVKSYSSLEAAIHEARKNGLVDKLFAAAAAQYIDRQHQHCVTPIPSNVDDRKLAALGFAQPRPELGF